MSNALTDPLRIPLGRNGKMREVEVCIPAIIKWAMGVFATLVTTGMIAGVSLLWGIAANQAVFRTKIESIEGHLVKIEAKVEKVREDPFTGADAEKLEARLRDEMRNGK